MLTQFKKLKTVIRALACLMIMLVVSASIGACAVDPNTGKKILDPAFVQTVKDDGKMLLAACQWAAPIAAGIIGVTGTTEEQAAMKMASASVGELSVIADGSTDAATNQSSLAALQTAWNGLDAAYKKEPDAVAKLQAIPPAVAAAKQITSPATAPTTVITPLDPTSAAASNTASNTSISTAVGTAGK